MAKKTSMPGLSFVGSMVSRFQVEKTLEMLSRISWKFSNFWEDPLIIEQFAIENDRLHRIFHSYLSFPEDTQWGPSGNEERTDHLSWWVGEGALDRERPVSMSSFANKQNVGIVSG